MFSKGKKFIIFYTFLIAGFGVALFLGSYGLINRIATKNDYDVVEAVVVDMHGIVENFDQGKKWFPKIAVDFTYNGVEYSHVRVYSFDFFVYNGKTVKIQIKIDDPNIARPNLPLISITLFVMGILGTSLAIKCLIKDLKSNKQLDS